MCVKWNNHMLGDLRFEHCRFVAEQTLKVIDDLARDLTAGFKQESGVVWELVPPQRGASVVGWETEPHILEKLQVQVKNFRIQSNGRVWYDGEKVSNGAYSVTLSLGKKLKREKLDERHSSKHVQQKLGNLAQALRKFVKTGGHLEAVRDWLHIWYGGL